MPSKKFQPVDPAPKPPRRRASSDNRLKYIEAREMGMYPAQAARYAGYKDPVKSARHLEHEDPIVMEAIAEIEKRNRETLNMTREKVMEGLLDAIQLAKLNDDAGSMIRGFAEVNRMCGHYEPERKEVTIVSASAAERRRAISQASDEELLKLIGGKMVEGEYEVLDEDAD